MLDDKIKFLKTDLASEKYRRHEDMREVTDAAHNSFDKLEQGLNDEKNIQEEGDFVILQKVNERVEGMARDIKDHIENRESYEKVKIAKKLNFFGDIFFCFLLTFLEGVD